MASQVTNYKCPACGGPLHYGSGSGEMECDYCGSKYPVAEIEAMYAPQEEAAQAAAREAEAQAEEDEGQEPREHDESHWDLDSAGSQWGQEEETMRSYSCPSCGAELICEETTAATSCPYCGNPTVIPGQFGGTLRPDYVVPFKLSKEDAAKALKKHYKGKLLLPSAFSRENHVREIKGVYVPFWLFDGTVEADMVFHATRSRTHREGDYEVTDTSHYRVIRSGSMAFEKVPVDASSKMPDDLMDSLEPYDYQDLKEFSTAYLPGYLADKYDVSTRDASQRADIRCKNSTVSHLEDTARGYDTLSVRSKDLRLQRGTVKYALLPVWLLTTKWKEETYLFAMNGQTGKMVGNLPVDKGKLRLWFWGTAAAASLIFSLLLSGPLGRMIGRWFM